MNDASPTLFNRFLLPGFAFKAVVIGGGYATGRELAEFFLPSGPWGGMLGMALTMILWSGICALTFLFARATNSNNYRSFFEQLLGRAWILFDIAYFCMVFLVLSVFAAAAGAITETTFGLPSRAGTIALITGIAGITMFGSPSVERLFKYVTYFLYLVYIIFLVLTLAKSSTQIQLQFASNTNIDHWFTAGVTYASYNVVGAVVILPVLRHLTSNRDAVVAGILCGPLAIIPAVLFYLGMVAYSPAIANEQLPSDYMLSRLNAPILHFSFQIMILLALLESGSGLVHAVNERVASAFRERGKPVSNRMRLGLSAALLVFSVFVAGQFGLVALIAGGYRFLAYLILAVFVVPLFTVGIWRLRSTFLSGNRSGPVRRDQPPFV